MFIHVRPRGWVRLLLLAAFTVGTVHLSAGFVWPAKNLGEACPNGKCSGQWSCVYGLNKICCFDTSGRCTDYSCIPQPICPDP
jgi:hypothetical protein